MRFFLLFFLAQLSINAQERFIPHITTPGLGFETRILISNLSEAQQSWEILAYDLQGNLLTTQLGSIDPTVTLNLTPQELFSLDNVSHFSVQTHEQVHFTTIYVAEKDNAGPAHVSEITQKGTKWRIPAGNRNLTWDGIAVVNLGQTHTPITFHFYDADNNLIQSFSPFYPLQPFEKEVYLLSNIIEENAAWFEVLTTEEVVLIALRGVWTGDFLWENIAIAK